MFKSLKIRLAITVVVCLVALYFLLPTLVAQIPSPWNNYFPKDKIHLGLDLQGGMHLILEVDADKALESMMERTAGDLKESLMENRVRFRNVEKAKGATITMELSEASGKPALEKLLNEQFSDLEITSSTPREGGQMITLGVKNKRAADLKKTDRGAQRRNHPQPCGPVRRCRAGNCSGRRKPHYGPVAGHQGSGTG